MGLPRKRRAVQIRFAEIAGASLLCGTIALGVHWFVQQQRANAWNTAQARIAGVEAPGTQAGGPSAGSVAIVYYTYTAGGRTYTGSTEPGVVERALAAILPAMIMHRLNANGIYTFADLPEEARRMIREGTSYTFDDLPEADRAALQDAGYESAEDLRRTALAAMDGSENADEGTRESELTAGSGTGMHVYRPGDEVPEPAESATVPITYDPEDPTRSRIVTGSSGAASDIVGLVMLVALAALTCVYFGVAYPSLKMQGY